MARRISNFSLDREQPRKLERPTILIVCEGKNTEPSYFDQFRLSSATVKTFGDIGDPINVVNYAEKLNNSKKYDEVWCVFDKDDIKDTDFLKAIEDARKLSFDVCYSNQSFEYWLILHFEDHQGGVMARTDYNDRINGYINPLGASYDGKGRKIISKAFFDLLDGVDSKSNELRVQLAIDRAKRIYAIHKHVTPAQAESCTTVFRLVKRFLKYKN